MGINHEAPPCAVFLSSLLSSLSEPKISSLAPYSQTQSASLFVTPWMYKAEWRYSSTNSASTLHGSELPVSRPGNFILRETIPHYPPLFCGRMRGLRKRFKFSENVPFDLENRFSVTESVRSLYWPSCSDMCASYQIQKLSVPNCCGSTPLRLLIFVVGLVKSAGSGLRRN